MGGVAPAASNSVCHVSGYRRAQRGSYALEFALVFVVFFLVLYGILTYGLVFLAQNSVTLAAQDGARKVLQWQAGTTSLAARANAGRDTAVNIASWMSSMSVAPIKVAVCGSGG
ncbi:MAG TPA: hypothetical protein DDZ58_04430, partial [Achromobacter sp.]|nr:hypothetical protein [Achromobacter sp.]